MSKLDTILVLAVLLGLSLPARAADPLDGWRVVQVAAADRLAVVRSPAGELQLVRGGERLSGLLAVTGFDGASLVLERPGEWGRVTLYADAAGAVSSRERQPLRTATISGREAAIAVGEK